MANARIEPRRNAIITIKQAASIASVDPSMGAFNGIVLMVAFGLHRGSAPV
jgi:hypothetical protein